MDKYKLVIQLKRSKTSNVPVDVLGEERQVIQAKSTRGQCRLT